MGGTFIAGSWRHSLLIYNYKNELRDYRASGVSGIIRLTIVHVVKGEDGSNGTVRVGRVWPS